MPKKQDKKKEAEMAKSTKKGKSQKKKKWSTSHVKESRENMVLFDDATYEKLKSEVPTYKLLTVSILSERLRISGSLARAALNDLHSKGEIQLVSNHKGCKIYTRK